MKRILFVSAITLTVVVLASSQSRSDQAKTSQLEGTWEMVSGYGAIRPAQGRRQIKIFSRGHFVFALYNTETGKLIWAGGGTYTLNGTSYTEHVDFMSEAISAGIAGKDQSFTVTVEGDTLTQKGRLSSGEKLNETWKRVD